MQDWLEPLTGGVLLGITLLDTTSPSEPCLKSKLHPGSAELAGATCRSER